MHVDNLHKLYLVAWGDEDVITILGFRSSLSSIVVVDIINSIVEVLSSNFSWISLRWLLWVAKAHNPLRQPRTVHLYQSSFQVSQQTITGKDPRWSLNRVAEGQITLARASCDTVACLQRRLLCFTNLHSLNRPWLLQNFQLNYKS